MSLEIRRVNYYYCNIKDRPGEAYQLLSGLSDLGVNLLAFQAIPLGLSNTQLALFPEDDLSFTSLAKNIGLILEGPHSAILVQGDDEIGALARIHEKLYKANVNVYAANGVTNTKGGFGYVIYIRPHDYENATTALNL